MVRMTVLAFALSAMIVGTGHAAAPVPNHPDALIKIREGRAILPDGVSIAASLGDQATSTQDENPQETYARQLKFAASFGTFARYKDYLAGLAVSHLLKNYDLKDEKRLQGWITHQVDGVWQVYFIGEVDDRPAVLFVVDMEEATVKSDSILHEPDGVLLPADIEAMWRARLFGIANMGVRCSNYYSQIVIPVSSRVGGETVPAFMVYMIATPTNQNMLILGGHYRIVMNKTATALYEMKSYSQTCLTLEFEKEGRELVGLIAPYLDGEHPEDIHVFQSLWYGLPIYVMTMKNGYLWMVSGNKIMWMPDTDEEDGEGTGTVADLFTGFPAHLPRPKVGTQKVDPMRRGPFQSVFGTRIAPRAGHENGDNGKL